MKRALAAEFVIIGYTSIGLVVFPVVEDMIAQGQVGSGVAAGAPDVFAQAGIVRIDWQTAMRFVPMGVSGAWGIMLLSLIAAYVFGRELREGTDVTMATLPVRREWFVVAKLVVIAVWVAALAALAVVAQVAVDALMIDLDTFAWVHVWRAFVDTLYACLPIYLTLPLVGWLSVTRRGYLRPMLFALVMFMVANSLIGLEASRYFPWSMPIAAVGVTWMPLAKGLSAASWAIAGATFAGGLALVMRAFNRVGEAA